MLSESKGKPHCYFACHLVCNTHPSPFLLFAFYCVESPYRPHKEFSLLALRILIYQRQCRVIILLSLPTRYLIFVQLITLLLTCLGHPGLIVFFGNVSVKNKHVIFILNDSTSSAHFLIS